VRASARVLDGVAAICYFVLQSNFRDWKTRQSSSFVSLNQPPIAAFRRRNTMTSDFVGFMSIVIIALGIAVQAVCAVASLMLEVSRRKEDVRQ
jgi:hypothetical protein